MRFIHLRVHSEYSLIDGLVRVKALVRAAAANGMPAVAITDHNNLFAAIKFQKAAESEGVQPLFGADLPMQFDGEQSDGVMPVLVQGATGYANLIALISRAYQENQHHGVARVKWEWLAAQNAGLIVLSGARQGPLGPLIMGGRHAEALSLAARLDEAFPGRFYLEVQRTGREGDELCVHGSVRLAAELDLPLVATNDVRFLAAEDFEAHEARVCINSGHVLDDSRRPRLYSEAQYFRSHDEMVALFSDIPEAIENTWHIARRCAQQIRVGKSFLPDFPLGEGETVEQKLIADSEAGLDQRLHQLFDIQQPDFEQTRKAYYERLHFELNVINEMGFPGYFLIVADFIRWSKENGIAVGPGRGSGAGSLVAYALGITDLDPIEYDLLFERFLNPERVSMPDFDIDFCMDRRDEVIEYVKQRYGKDAVSQIITFGTMAAKAVVRDVARVQGKSYGLADKLSKLIPFEVGMTLGKAHEQEPAIREFLESGPDAEDAQEIWDMALKLEGLPRNVGKHAGGVVIAPGRLTDFSPLYCDDTGENLVTQFDKDDVEQAGLVKFDFLGLRTLTIIESALRMVNARRTRQGKRSIDIATIPLDDQPTFELLQRAETTAVFQLESSGMKDLIARLRPDKFEDIVALVALFRPGPLQSGMVDDFIKRKNDDDEPISYPHPEYQLESLKPVLEPTYGIILYQEQVMQIAQVMAGYSLGGADLLRRAMGKKKIEEMEKQKGGFLDGCERNGIDRKLAANIFDLVEKFAGYGFNKSHSAAYALVSYQTAWLKAHYPAEFMAAVLSADMDNTDKVVTLIDECHRLGLRTVPPDANCCDYVFTVNEEGDVVYGLGAIKGLGKAPADAIVEARRHGGAFADLFDFCRRVDIRRVNRRTLEALVRAGAFDALGPNRHFDDRATLFASLDTAMQVADQMLHNAEAGISDLFGDVQPEDENGAFALRRPWRIEDRLDGERETLGLYLTGHPIDSYEAEIRQLVDFSLARIPAPTATDKGNGRQRGRVARIAGLIVAIKVVRSRRDERRMGFVTIDDKSGRREISVFGDLFDQVQHLLHKDRIVVAEVEISADRNGGDELRIVARQLMDMAEARSTLARRLCVSIREEVVSTDIARQLHGMVADFQGGGCQLLFRYRSHKAQGLIRAGEQWLVRPDDLLIQRLRDKLGPDAVEVLYR